MKFDALISYRRSDGSTVAQRLRHALRNYRLPAALGSAERRLSIYLDTIFERANDDFFEQTIKPALSESRFLIVVITPDVLKSRPGGNWVMREIEYFRTLPQGRNILFATACSEWTTAVPPELGAPPNPELVDLRGYLGRRNGVPPAREEVLKFIATLYDVPAERMPELREEDARQRLAQARNVSIALAVIIAALGGLLGYALRQRNTTRRELATGHVLNAQMNIDGGDAAVSLLWIAAAARLHKSDKQASRIDRIRFGAVLRASPRLMHVQPGPVSRVVFDAAGARWISFGIDTESANVYDTATGRMLVRLPMRHVEIATFSPDGRRIATAGGSIVRVWDAATGRTLTPVLEHQYEVMQLDFRAGSDDLVVAADGDDAHVHVWSMSPVRVRFRIDDEARATYSTDGTRLLTFNGSVAHIRDASTGASLFALQHPEAIATAVFSYDGRRVATGGHDRLVRVWDAATGALVGRPSEPVDAAAAASFSPDGTKLVIFGDEVAHIADAATGSPLTATLPNLHGLVGARFTDDGRHVLTEGDGAIRVWDAATGRAAAWIVRDRVRDFDLRGDSIVTAHSTGVRLWKFDTGVGKIVRSDTSGVNVIQTAFSAAAPRFVTASSEGPLQVWEIANGRARVIWSVANGGRFRSAAISRDGKRVLTGVVDGVVSLWSVGRATPLFSVKHDGLVCDLTFSPDETRFAAVSWDDRAVRVWSAADGHPITRPLAHRWRPFSVHFREDGREIVTASEDGRVWVRDAATGAARMFLRHDRATYAEFSHDGRYIATASTDNRSGSAIIWDAATGERLHELRHIDNVLYATFSPDGKRVATVSLDRTARIWDVETGRPLTPPLQHADRLWDVRFSPDGLLAVTTCYDGTARVWDTTSGLPVTPILRHRDGVESCAFSGDSRWLVTTSRAGDIHLHDLAPDPRPLDVLEAAARISSGQRLVPGGGVFPLDDAEFARDASQVLTTP
jgi:WD40 repeat protein